MERLIGLALGIIAGLTVGSPFCRVFGELAAESLKDVDTPAALLLHFVVMEAVGLAVMGIIKQIAGDLERKAVLGGATFFAIFGLIFC